MALMNDFNLAYWFYFLLPVFIANMAPLLARFFHARPLDFGVKWKGKRLLGKGKTWLGALFGVLGGVLTAFLQARFYPQLLPYAPENALLVGFLLGAGAVFGDAIKSFFKRRRGILPGESWAPYDQIDFAVGGLLLVSPIVFPGFMITLILVVISGVLHLASTFSGYLLGIRKQPI